MEEQKSFLYHLAEAYERYRAERRAARGTHEPSGQSGWWRRLVYHLMPNVGTILVAIALLWAQSVGALPQSLISNTQSLTTTIAYQGRLADSAGNPLTGTYNMIFRLYDVPTGGTPLWEEQWTGSNGVRVSDGLFNVMLGSLNPIGADVIAGHDQLWLGITVGTDNEMQPRVQLGSVPFAVQALTVPDGSITTAKIADGAVTRAKLGSDVNTMRMESGTVGANYVANSDWDLHQGTGSRSYTVHVGFPEPFQSVPVVLVSLRMLDVGNVRNTRVRVYAENVTQEGFDLVIHTWADTVLYGVEVTWMAYVQE